MFVNNSWMKDRDTIHEFYVSSCSSPVTRVPYLPLFVSSQCVSFYQGRLSILPRFPLLCTGCLIKPVREDSTTTDGREWHLKVQVVLKVSPIVDYRRRWSLSPSPQSTWTQVLGIDSEWSYTGTVQDIEVIRVVRSRSFMSNDVPSVITYNQFSISRRRSDGLKSVHWNLFTKSER